MAKFSGKKSKNPIFGAFCGEDITFKKSSFVMQSTTWCL